jgi:hypothetical protein
VIDAARKRDEHPNTHLYRGPRFDGNGRLLATAGHHEQVHPLGLADALFGMAELIEPAQISPSGEGKGRSAAASAAAEHNLRAGRRRGAKRELVKLKRYELTPQMRDYDDMKDPGERRYLPYLMYFHRTDYTSPSVNTDGSGFRISTGPDGTIASAAGRIPPGPLRILAGGSSALGVGASSDSNTLASLLWSRYAPAGPWLNFGSYCYNPTQEVLLLTLYRHRLGDIEEIVIFSGINAVMVSRLPEWQQGEHGAFFFCGEYYEKMEELRARHRKGSRRFGRRATATISTLDDVRHDIPTVIASAAEMAIRQLDIWRRIAGPGTRISYVLQPMARWMPYTLAPEEAVLFAENDRMSELGPWEEVFADVATTDFARAYATALRVGCEKHDIRFVDLNPVLTEVVTAQDWIFTDRVHYTDTGHDIVARVTAEVLGLS